LFQYEPGLLVESRPWQPQSMGLLPEMQPMPVAEQDLGRAIARITGELAAN